ncbi:MAG TPA: hypothetical protein VIH86_05620, partial [Puia sp.]
MTKKADVLIKQSYVVKGVYKININIMAYKIRKKRLSKGFTSLYLDIHRDGRRYYKFLGLKYKEIASTYHEKNEKKEAILLAKKIASKYELDEVYNEFGITKTISNTVDF